MAREVYPAKAIQPENLSMYGLTPSTRAVRLHLQNRLCTFAAAAGATGSTYTDVDRGRIANC